MYAQDYDETYATGLQELWWDCTWYRVASSYVKSDGVFKCPSDPDVSFVNSGYSWAGPRFSYVANGYLTYRNGANRLVGITGVAQKWIVDQGGNVTTAIADVKRPADTIMLAERQHRWKDEQNSPGNVLSWGPGSIATGVNWWDWAGSPSLIPDGSRTAVPTNDPTGPSGGILPAHQAQSNFCFADGHVKSMEPKATNPQLAADSQAQKDSKNMWDAYRN